MPSQRPAPSPALFEQDSDLAARVARREDAAFETLMRCYNGRLFRVARAILRDDTEAEDVLQDAYIDAYRHIGTFRGGAQLGTWLTRLTINQALMRLRKQKRERVVVSIGWRGEGITPRGHDSAGGAAEDDEVTRRSEKVSADRTSREDAMRDDRAEPPPRAVLRAEVRALLERRIDELPVAFRTVFVMRDVEDMSVEQTAECLSIPAATVRTRLFRARALLREALARDLDAATIDVFGFAGARCDRIVAGVFERLARSEHS